MILFISLSWFGRWAPPKETSQCSRLAQAILRDETELALGTKRVNFQFLESKQNNKNIIKEKCLMKVL